MNNKKPRNYTTRQDNYNTITEQSQNNNKTRQSQNNNKTRQEKTRQDKTRQDKTRQDKIITRTVEKGPGGVFVNAAVVERCSAPLTLTCCPLGVSVVVREGNNRRQDKQDL